MNKGTRADDRTLMPISNRAYEEIYENLSDGYEQVLVGPNGELDLKGVRLIKSPPDDMPALRVVRPGQAA
jgi:hypothetical protein